jgi:hypothetical protein
MLFEKTIAVYCENHTEHSNPKEEREVESIVEDEREKSWEK